MDHQGYIIARSILYLNYNKHSWLNWIYGLFQSKMEGDLKETLNSKLCDYVINATTEWNEAISSYPCKHITT